jgi:hypothetical protein
MSERTEFPISIKMSFKKKGVVLFFLCFADIVFGKVIKVKFQVSRESFRTTGPRKLFKGYCRIFNAHDPEAGIFFVTDDGFSAAIVTTWARYYEDLVYEDSADDDSLGLRMEKFQDVCRAEPTLDHYKTLKRRVERLMENETLLPDEDLDFIE